MNRRPHGVTYRERPGDQIGGCMDLATIQEWLRAADAQQPHPFRSSAECVTAMVEELGEVATEIALLEQIGTKAVWSKTPSTERLTTELIQLRLLHF